MDKSGTWYWTSTEYSAGLAWVQRFDDGYQYAGNKYDNRKFRCIRRIDPCTSPNPTPGAVCNGGAVYLGSLSPGATSGSGTDKYMTTPGGCGEIPAAQKMTGINSPGGDYPNSDFTPTCSGTDSLTKYWNNGSLTFALVPGLQTYTNYAGAIYGAINKDDNYGSTNTTNIVAVTAAASGGYHAAALYCDKLNLGGYTDWYLPNRYELNLMFTNAGSIPGLDKSGNYYHSSTQYNYSASWQQRFSDGDQKYDSSKSAAFRVRCVRRY